MKKLNEDKLGPIIIDLTNGKNLNESWYRMFGTWIKLFLGHMLNLNRYNFKVKGTRRQVDIFVKTLKAEKRYMDAFKKAGLSDPRAIKNKSLLNKAVSRFEKATGIKWPLK